MGNSLTSRPCYNVNIRLTQNNFDGSLVKNGDLKHYYDLLRRSRIMLNQVNGYNGCTSLIRECYKHNQKLNSSADEKSRLDAENSLIACFEKVSKNAEMVMDCYELIVEMGLAMKKLSTNLFQENIEENSILLLEPSTGQEEEHHDHDYHPSPKTPHHHGISVHQRISILTELVVFVLHFDLIKSTSPDVQNDYSYFKREVSSSRMQGLYTKVRNFSLSKRMTDNALISTVSMWLAESFPCSRYLRTSFQRTHAEEMINNSHLSDVRPNGTGFAHNPPSPRSHVTHNSEYYETKHRDSDSFKIGGSKDDRKISDSDKYTFNPYTVPEDSPVACLPGYAVCPSIVSYGLIANIIACMFHRRHETLFSQSNSALVDVKDRYITSMVCCAVLYDIMNCSGSSQSINEDDAVKNPAGPKYYTTQSIFAVGSFVKTSKIIAVVLEFTPKVERTILFNIIKYCSATYENKNTKQTIVKMMDAQ